MLQNNLTKEAYFLRFESIKETNIKDFFYEQ